MMGSMLEREKFCRRGSGEGAGRTEAFLSGKSLENFGDAYRIASQPHFKKAQTPGVE
jgi:hypothetical protein